MRQFRPWRHDSKSPFNSKSPFECEKDAYTLILQEEPDREKCPVVEAYGWFTLPKNFQAQSSRLSTVGEPCYLNLTGDHKANVLVKKVLNPNVGTLPRLHNPPSRNIKSSIHPEVLAIHPDEVLEHFNVLLEFGIYIPDLNPDNFLGGKISDLSSALILDKAESEKQRVKELVRVKRLVLAFNQWEGSRGMTDDEVDDCWAEFRRKFEQMMHTSMSMNPANGERELVEEPWATTLTLTQR